MTSPEPNQVVVKLDPSTGIRILVGAHRADARGTVAPIDLDMEFAEEGGEGPTPYEVLLHAAMVGDSTRFTRQDGVEEQWRMMQPLLDAPPPVHAYAPGSWGPEGGRHARRGSRPLARALDRGVSDGQSAAGAGAQQSAAAPSPFPPIADYAFLSNCHTGALVAADGAVDWLCVPSFDSPSVFGSLLDRQAGFFRLAPYGINHPSARVYEPGTNVLFTTWKTPMGWIEVRDALTMGPTRGTTTSRRIRATGGRRRRPHARSHGPVHRGPRRGRARLRAGVRLRADPGGVDARRRRPAPGRRDRRRRDDPPPLRSALGIEGNRVRGRHVLEQGERRTAASPGPRASWPRRTPTRRTRGSSRPRFWRGWLGRARIPDHRWRDPIQRSALAIKGLTYMPTGATVAALTTSLPETPGGERNWDYRYTWMRDSTFTLQALHWLNLDWEADEFMQFVADLEANDDGALQIMYGIDGRRDLTESTLDHLSGYAGASPVPIGNGAFDQRQNDVFGAVLDSILLHTRGQRLRGASGRSWRRRPNARQGSGRTPTRASGRPAARPSTTSPRS